MLVRENFDATHVWHNNSTLAQDAQKGQTSHPPNPGAPRRALSHARPQRTIPSHKGWVGWSQLRASNEGLLRPRVARARGSSHPPCPFFSILLETIMKGPWPVKVGSVNSRLHIASIIHERFCCNRRSAATTSLRPAGSPLGPSTYCKSTHRGLTAPRAGLATRFSDVATNRHE